MLAERASRADIRRAALRPTGARPGVTSASRRPARPAGRLARVTEQRRTTERQARPEQGRPEQAQRQRAEPRRVTRSVRVRTTRVNRTRPVARAITRHASAPRRQRVMRLGNMTAVVAYAKSQIGRRYVSGGEGGSGFDCSGLTKQAYARAGISLPHSSGAQAARARRITRSQARAGDLVVGRGHVGIYMGNGMMIDAGNHRTGVVYRKLYSGLSVERL
ncbi:C40 family peptidase [Paractinoplanes durhamensis]|uniref:C40 family peptidase n=1 Tax=Paractinoplanes durhamensis TaxID=113563 RepID=UPI001EF2B7DB|nr:NlpC/P60 family protein [Actinoplanes durhamensis]